MTSLSNGNLKAAVLFTVLAIGINSSVKANEIVKSVCTVTRLTAIEKRAVDILGWAAGTFKCEDQIGVAIDKNTVFVSVSENDYTDIAQMFETGEAAQFEFNGTYAGLLHSYNGRLANNAKKVAERVGIQNLGDKTVLTFVDVETSMNKRILAAIKEVGALKLSSDNAAIELSQLSVSRGQLRLTARTSDITQLLLAVGGGIQLSNGQKIGSDQIEIKGQSALEIGRLLEKAGLAVNQGHFRRAGSSYSSFWDYVYLDKDGVDPLFHCANIHESNKSAACYISQIRLK